jgi:hypothetical protein
MYRGGDKQKNKTTHHHDNERSLTCLERLPRCLFLFLAHNDSS